MRRLTESLVGFAILAGMLYAIAFRSEQFYGSWGVEPDAQSLAIWRQFVAAHPPKTSLYDPGTYKLLRISAPRNIFDGRLGRQVSILKAEYFQEFEDAPRRHETMHISFEGGKALRWYYQNQGPKEYREAF